MVITMQSYTKSPARLVEIQQVMNALINLRHDALMLEMGAKLGGVSIAIDARPASDIAREIS